jgi:predicted O-methyltransferase YrrM
MLEYRDEFYKMRPEQYIQGLNDLINYINSLENTKNLNLVEIGSYVGESTVIFAEHFKSVTSIDPFTDNYDLTDPACSYKPFDEVYHNFLENIKNYDNITHIRKTSDDSVILFDDNSIDVLYIDGLHTYEQVKKDIVNYLPKIKQSGFICGHDYHENWIGVIKAITETIVSVDKIFVDTSWLKKI